MMFKKIHEINEKLTGVSGKMSGLYGNVDGRFKDISNNIQLIRIAIQHIPQLKYMQQTIDSQQRTIEQLTNALKDKYEHGLFMFSENGKIPMVIRNGKEITNEMTSYCSVEWSRDELPRINIEQDGVTYHDMEV